LASICACLMLLGAPAVAQPAPVPRLSAHEELRIGSVNDPRYDLSRVSDLLVDANGSIYVGQPQEHVVRVFDRSGRALHTIGRRGGGPGEFQSVGDLGWRGDSLWVRDSRLNRLSFFAREGGFLGSVEFQEPHPERSSFLLPGIPAADGNLLVRPNASIQLIGNSIQSLPVLLTSRSGAVRRKLAELSLRNSVATISFGGSGGSSGPQPFSDAPLWTPTADGRFIWVIDRRAAATPSASFRLTRISLQGDTVVSRSYRYTPRPVPAQQVDSVIRGHVDRLAAGPGRGQPRPTVERWVRDAIYLPPNAPPINRAISGSDGSLWLRTENGSASTTVWYVFDGAGELKSMVFLPRGLVVHQTAARHVWGVVEDDLGVPYVVRFRVGR
jgi:hypothetical protein